MPEKNHVFGLSIFLEKNALINNSLLIDSNSRIEQIRDDRVVSATADTFCCVKKVGKRKGSRPKTAILTN